MLSAETTKLWGGWLDTLSQPSPTGPDTAEPEVAEMSFEIMTCDVVGKGSVIASASVLVAVGGVEILVRGWTLSRQRGQYVIAPPQHRDPRSGEWVVSLDLPKPLFLEIGLAIYEAAGLTLDPEEVEAARAA